MAAAAIINDRAERQTPQAHNQPQPELEQDAFLQLAGELIESGQELGFASTKLLLPALESEPHLQKLSFGSTVICTCMSITSLLAPKSTRDSLFPSPGGAEHLP